MGTRANWSRNPKRGLYMGWLLVLAKGVYSTVSHLGPENLELGVDWSRNLRRV
ncbi:hypothetical protein CFELI_03870 [Corynebacterium felinum]|uniref:Uncharacterized protein n=1 Tax=Corynebacterium felinum TaxID=131318 RepID=A0ABU2B8U0_9CORY|nr:hypothetical protein [Corynebacterium felinum]MDR7355055.1 hypothetical protein [Corynebacterium felinum]WJY94407.1 hypothetical protein CFELI_03870 [Corynebacterium felinum]